MPSLTKVQTGFIEPQGPLELTAGTQQAPSLFFSGSTTTGWYSPAANQLAVSANGAETVRIRDNGFVGIGTTNPISNLHVVTNTVQYGYLVRGQNRGTGSIENLLQTDKGICVWGLNSNLGGAMLDTAGAGDLIFNVRTGGNVVFSADVQYQEQHLVITEPGNVGVGTTNPLAKLHVSSVNGDIYQQSTQGTGRTWVTRTSGENATEYELRDVTGSQRAMFYGVPSGGYSGWWFYSNNIVRMRIDGSGNVGIGTDNPGTKLSVNGFITENPGDGTYWNVVTQKDIGYGSNQVPLNQYLGQLAFIDQYSPSGLRRDGGGTDDVFVDSEGRVGIGTNSTTFRCSIHNAAKTSASESVLGLSSTDSSNAFQLLFGRSSSSVTSPFWAIDSVEQNVAFRNIVLQRSGGNVGIGLTEPLARLHVVGQTFVATGGKSGSNTYLSLQSTDATNKMELGFTNLTNLAWQIQAVENGVSYRHLVLNPVGGRVGIGLTNPSTLLTVSGDSNAVTSEPFGDFQNNGQLFITGSTNKDKRLAMGVDTTTAAMFSVIQSIEAGISARPLVLNPSGGNVGIGTTNPSKRFHSYGSALIDNGNYLNDNGLTINKPHSLGLTNGVLVRADVNYNESAEYLTAAVKLVAPGGYAVGISTNASATGVGGSQNAWISFAGNAYFAGNVGIGTASPSTKLSVNGFITENPGDGTYWNVVTQKDIGYGSNQVPLNQYLGQLAFIDQYSPSGLRRDGGGSDDVFVDSNGNVGVATTTPTTIFDVNGNSIRVRTARTPASATAAGNQGEICWDASYIYICIAPNTWRRVAISAW